MCDCCCNSSNKGLYQIGIIISSIFIIIFQLLIVIIYQSAIDPEEIESFIFSERPFYDFELSKNKINNKKNITFFEFKGRERKEGNKTIKYDEVDFTKIYQNEFYYDGKDRNYFDYKKEYSVEPGKNCHDNYKKCGILDSGERILCLPMNEECPLNGFGISSLNNDPLYEGYQYKEAYDSVNDINYYFYYTNNNINGQIITEFKLSKDLPCAKISEKNWISYYDNEVEGNYGCKTYINNNQYSNRYHSVSPEGINMVGLYNDNGLDDSPDYSSVYRTSVNLYVRNYNEIDEECFNKFLQDLNNEKKYYDSIRSVVKALGTVSLFLIIGNFIYMIAICRCEVTFYFIFIVVPIYGIISNAVIIGIINKKRIKYKCQLEGFNEAIDKLVDEQYDNNNLLYIVMGAFSLAFYILIFIFMLCFKFMRNKNIGGIATSVGVPVVAMQPGIMPGYPSNYVSKIAFQNMGAAPGTTGIL